MLGRELRLRKLGRKAKRYVRSSGGLEAAKHSTAARGRASKRSSDQLAPAPLFGGAALGQPCCLARLNATSALRVPSSLLHRKIHPAEEQGLSHKNCKPNPASLGSQTTAPRPLWSPTEMDPFTILPASRCPSLM